MRQPTDPRRRQPDDEKANNSNSKINDRNALGAEGEARAARYLERRGYRIVARNVRVDRVEMDLIARRGPTLVFVEVKTRRTRAYGLAEEAVDARKRARLLRGASAWLSEHRRGARHVRFDVIACETDRDGRHWNIRHIQNAFDAGD